MTQGAPVRPGSSAVSQCPRCGRTEPGRAATTCPYCGAAKGHRSLEWVATVPPGQYSNRGRRQRRGRYRGPPSYASPPRWGFRPGGWRRPLQFLPPRATAAERTRTLAATAVPVLWMAAVTAVLSAAAEGWRYAILLESRFDAVAAGPLRWSDALVTTFGVLSLLAGIMALLVVLCWGVVAYRAAAEVSGVAPPRPLWWIVVATLVPGINLSVPGSVLTEIEHAALRQDPVRRPWPSRLLLGWWALWVCTVGLTVLTFLWGLRGSVQAQADTVVLHALLGVLAAVLAYYTIIVIRRLTALLSPVPAQQLRRMRVVKIDNDAGGEPVRWSPAGRAARG